MRQCRTECTFPRTGHCRHDQRIAAPFDDSGVQNQIRAWLVKHAEVQCPFQQWHSDGARFGGIDRAPIGDDTDPFSCHAAGKDHNFMIGVVRAVQYREASIKEGDVLDDVLERRSQADNERSHTPTQALTGCPLD